MRGASIKIIEIARLPVNCERSRYFIVHKDHHVMRAISIRQLFIVVTLITDATFTMLTVQGRKMLSQRLSYQILSHTYLQSGYRIN